MAAKRVAEHVTHVEKRLAARLATLDKERGTAAVASTAQVEGGRSTQRQTQAATGPSHKVTLTAPKSLGKIQNQHYTLSYELENGFLSGQKIGEHTDTSCNIMFMGYTLRV